MNTNTEIANLALSKLGQTQTLTDLDTDVGTVATACRTAFANARDEALAARAWPFASRRRRLVPYLPPAYAGATPYAAGDIVSSGDALYVSLANGNQGNALTDTTKWEAVDSFVTNWAFAYSLPSDFLCAQFLVPPGAKDPTAAQRLAYELAPDQAGTAKVLLADAEDVELLYTMRLTTVAMYPPHFCDALAWRLAAELALSLPKDRVLSAQLMAQYERVVSSAFAFELAQRERNIGDKAETPSIAARR